MHDIFNYGIKRQVPNDSALQKAFISENRDSWIKLKINVAEDTQFKILNLYKPVIVQLPMNTNVWLQGI